ncbi:MAG TPA: hypothetical protein DCZ89_01350, partial [Geobacter sulfurreducens]|nr:hypothetical protein [Geobacter sulfurreducens]
PDCESGPFFVVSCQRVRTVFKQMCRLCHGSPTAAAGPAQRRGDFGDLLILLPGASTIPPTLRESPIPPSDGIGDFFRGMR